MNSKDTGDKLDRLILHYAQIELSKHKIDNSIIDSHECLCNQIRQDILNEIIKKEKEKYKREVLEEIEIELEKKKISHLESVLFESILLAFLVGLVVNQVSNMMLPDYSHYKYTISLIVLLIAAIYFFLKCIYFSKISKLIHTRKNDNQN